MGLLEAFGAIEEDHGALTPEEVAWAREAYQRMGCRTLQTGLTHADRLRVMDLGRRCAAAWEDRKKT
jgi:hypothetical protein